MFRFFVGRLPAIALAMLFSVGVARAELAPGSYDTMRMEAKEALVIEVLGVKSVKGTSDTAYTVEAKVLGVERTDNKLKVGDKITIQYSVPDKIIPGPSHVPVLEKGNFLPAFLNKEGKAYSPAAYGRSFTMTPAQ